MLLSAESDNPKLNKKPRIAAKYCNSGLSLYPGAKVCPWITPSCGPNCLTFCGLGGLYPNINEARKRKTEYLFADPELFRAELSVELRKHEKAAVNKNMRPVCRLNMFSDLSWWTIIRKFPEVLFYDYTKGMPRLMKLLEYKKKGLCLNYDLTFSQSERNELDCIKALAMGYNVATIFRSKKVIPKTWLGRPVIIGDEHDLRFLDPKGPRGYVIALTAKGKAKQDKTGLVKL